MYLEYDQAATVDKRNDRISDYTQNLGRTAEYDYVIVIDHGVIAAKGTPAELRTRYSSDTIKLLPIRCSPSATGIK